MTRDLGAGKILSWAFRSKEVYLHLAVSNSEVKKEKPAMKLKSGEEIVISDKAYIETMKVGEEEYKDFWEDSRGWLKSIFYYNNDWTVRQFVVNGS